MQKELNKLTKRTHPSYHGWVFWLDSNENPMFTYVPELKTIDVYNYGDMKRDFTYVDDIVAGIKLIVNRSFEFDKPQHEIYNIGRGQQVNLMNFISEIEKNFGRVLEKKFLPRHPADTLETWSDTTKLQALGWKPKVSIPEGVAKFAEWYKQYYGVNYDSKMG